jgi:anti-anti-sigma factor
MSELSQLEFSGDDVVVARVSGEIDLTATAYLDSSGVHLLFDLAERLQRRQQQLRVVVPEDAPVRRVLRIVELDETVPVTASVEEAVAAIRAAA